MGLRHSIISEPERGFQFVKGVLFQIFDKILEKAMVKNQYFGSFVISESITKK